MSEHVTEYLVTGRGGGKTHACLLWAKRLIESGELGERPVIAVHSDDEKERLRGMWIERYGEDDARMPRFYTYSEVRARAIEWREARLAIDNFDIWLQTQIGYPVSLVTASGKLA